MGRQAMQKGARGQHIAKRSDLNIGLTENIGKETLRRFIRDPPILAPPRHVVATDRADAGEGCMHHSARLQCAVRGDHRSLYFINYLQCLRQDYAIKLVLRDTGSGDEIADEGGSGVAGRGMQYFGANHPAAAEFAGIFRIGDFKDAPANIVSPLGQKLLDVVTIDRLAAIEAKDVADRLHPPQRAESNHANRRRMPPIILQLADDRSHSITILAASIMGRHCFSLAPIMSRMTSGVLPSGSASNASMRARSSGVWNAAATAADSVAATGFAVPGGAAIPIQVSA